mmetsp:Transcript_43180/g.126993  ORF Transcript_43180/g.126993 Transcript_43180/m.126993 type:complete len:127 (-) Transcript_43180:1167-1547(-)
MCMGMVQQSSLPPPVPHGAKAQITAVRLELLLPDIQLVYTTDSSGIQCISDPQLFVIERPRGRLRERLIDEATFVVRVTVRTGCQPPIIRRATCSPRQPNARPRRSELSAASTAERVTLAAMMMSV